MANLAGSFGPRYGRKLRARYSSIEKQQRKLHKCPKCNKMAVKRVAKGIFNCTKCTIKFAGKAYYP
jgi:large subunit ribosomal protein L37Ae